MPSSILTHPTLTGEVTKSPPALPNTSIPPPKPVAQHGLLMQAITSQKPVIVAAGAQVKDLVLQKISSGTSTSSDDATSPGEFVMKGTIDLFGSKSVTAEFDIWHGAPPPGVTLGSDTPSIQRAVIKGSVTLSQLVPSLGSVLRGADLTLQNVSICHQNYAYDPSLGLGYNLDADLVIDSSLGSLSSLSKVLGINEATVHIQADFGPNQTWSDSPTVNTLTIEGSFVGQTCVATPGVHITSVGVRLLLGHNPDKTAIHDVELFGKLNLTLPGGSVLPIELDYTLKDVDGMVQFSAALPSGVTWVNPMGVQGCVLNPVTFSSSLPTSDPWKGLKLDVEAKFQYQNSTIDFKGSYAPGGTFSIDANIKHFDFSSLRQFYEALHHEPLKVPSVDVTIESADISISSDKGFSAMLNNVCIAGHGSGNATLSFSSAGSVIHADLGTVQFEAMTINSAYIQLDLQPASSSKSSDATIYGDVSFEGLEFTAAVHLYPSAPDVVPRRTEWTVYAELTSSDNALALSKIAPKLKGTAFDLTLKDVLLISASQNDPDVGADIKDGYKPKKGIQVYATLDEIPVFNSLAKSNVTGMVLEASWKGSKDFDLSILLPVARNLNLGKGITTAPITLSLDMMPSQLDKAKLVPYLQISAGLYIPVARSPDPLLFQMKLSASETDASITADLEGNWVDPFKISNEVVVGPDLLLQADLDYATGLSGVLFKGGLAIGSTSALVVVSVNEDPEKEMLYAEIENLNFRDIVAFSEKLFHLKLPAPSSDFLEFEKLKLCICPAGLTVQDVTYPAGFSFESDMIVFGKHVDVSCDVSDDNTLSINGAVDDFQLGPLKVSGTDGAKQATVQVQVGDKIQHLLIDGATTLYADTCALHLVVDTQPSPEISFKTEFKLTELLTFEVDATLIGTLDWKDLSKADFSFNADLEQHLLDYIHDELIQLFTRAQQATEQGIENAKKRVSAERADIDSKIDKAKAGLEAARATWEAHQKSVSEANLVTITTYNAHIASLQAAITKAENQFNAALNKAQADLVNAQHDRQVKMQSAANDLRKAQQKLASDVREAQGRVAVAEANMNRKFGSAESDIENAKRKVEGLQNSMNDIENEINGLKHGPWYKKIKIAGLEIEWAGLEVGIKVAEGVLDVAEAALKSVDYVADKAAFDAAQKALELAGQAGNGLVLGCEETLASVDKLTQAVVDRASDMIKLVENGSDKIAFDGAKDALAAYKRTADGAFNLATKAISGLAQSAEYLAYESATTALAAAQGSTRGFNAANALLTEVEKGAVDVLNVGKAIANATVGMLDITSIHVSGTLGKSVAGDALAAEVKGVFMKKPFAFSVDLNPKKVEDFFLGILKELERDAKSAIHI